jgi:hypothetical protein
MPNSATVSSLTGGYSVMVTNSNLTAAPAALRSISGDFLSATSFSSIPTSPISVNVTL